jgi:hypothetical protein
VRVGLKDTSETPGPNTSASLGIKRFLFLAMVSLALCAGSKLLYAAVTGIVVNVF